MTNQFYSIFNGKKELPVDEINSLFQDYLADGSCTVEETSEGKCCPRINSIKAVTSYLETHPDIKTCDFRSFKTEVNDIPTLAEFLKRSTVRAIALNQGIPQEAKAKLEEAIAARKGGLKVQYFA